MAKGLPCWPIELHSAECAAACDVYDGRLALAREIAGDKMPATRRYQELLDNNEIDCIVAALPDHWHKKIALEVLSAGKDFYLEKPMSHWVEEGYEIVVPPAKAAESYRWAPNAAFPRLTGHPRDYRALTYTPQPGTETEPSYYADSFPQKIREDYQASGKTHDVYPGKEPIFAATTFCGRSFDSETPHLANFFQTVRTREPVFEDAIFGNHTAIACHMTNQSYFEKGPISFDPNARIQCANCGIDRLLSRH